MCGGHIRVCPQSALPGVAAAPMSICSHQSARRRDQLAAEPGVAAKIPAAHRRDAASFSASGEREQPARRAEHPTGRLGGHVVADQVEEPDLVGGLVKSAPQGPRISTTGNAVTCSTPVIAIHFRRSRGEFQPSQPVG